MEGVIFTLVLLASVHVCEGHCADKFLLLEKRLSFYDARLRCRQLGHTDLVTLDSLAQRQNAIRYLKSRNLAGTPVYIGLESRKGRFHWVDGTSLGLINWQPNEPKGTDASDTCVSMKSDESYQWATFHCNEKGLGLCEKRIPREASARFVLHARDVDTTALSMTSPQDAWSEEECSTLCLESCPECMYFIHVNGTCRLFDDVAQSSLVIPRAGARVFYKIYSE